MLAPMATQVDAYNDKPRKHSVSRQFCAVERFKKSTTGGNVTTAFVLGNEVERLASPTVRALPLVEML